MRTWIQWFGMMGFSGLICTSCLNKDEIGEAGVKDTNESKTDDQDGDDGDENPPADDDSREDGHDDDQADDDDGSPHGDDDRDDDDDSKPDEKTDREIVEDDDNDDDKDDGESEAEPDDDAGTKDWGQDEWAKGEPCESEDPDPEDYDYGRDYPPGPYGFKGSLCWNDSGDWGGGGESYEWGGGGDTLHNICLPNDKDEEVCLSDYLGGDYDLLVLTITTGWCPVCAVVAKSESQWMSGLKKAGFKPKFVSIVIDGEEQKVPATREDAASFKKRYGLKADVLYDGDWEWIERAMTDSWSSFRRDPSQQGFPFHFYVSLSNMRVWDSFTAFPYEYEFDNFMSDEGDMLDFCKKQPGAVAP